MNFSDYLLSKKIDEKAFLSAEPRLFEEWRSEFEQMHPNSFTVQKLNLINPIRRKYPLPLTASSAETSAAPPQTPMVAKPAKPVFKPKPKIN